MPKKLEWDKVGERLYETGVSNAALFVYNNGAYQKGVAWNGLTSVSESPTGAETTPLYANNTTYVNLLSREDYAATIEAYTYPEEFSKCNGETELAKGVTVGQQKRLSFGLVYKTKAGSDTDPDAGYKIHLIYGAIASPSQKQYSTVNDSPSAVTFSWSLKATPVEVPGMKPTATIVIDSTKADKTKLEAFEKIVYGSDTADAKMPTPAEVATAFA